MATFTCPHCRTLLTVTGPEPRPELQPPLADRLWLVMSMDPLAWRSARGWAETLHPQTVVDRSAQERTRRALEQLVNEGRAERRQDDSNPHLRRLPMLYTLGSPVAG